MADSATVARLEADIKFGTEAARLAAVNSLASTGGALVTDVLIRSLNRLIAQPDTTKYPSFPKGGPRRGENLEAVASIVEYFSSADHAWSPGLTDSLIIGLMATIDQFRDPRMSKGQAKRLGPLPLTNSKRWLTVGRCEGYINAGHCRAYPNIPHDSVFKALARIKGEVVDDILVEFGTIGSGTHQAPSFEQARARSTEDIMNAVTAICPQERIDRLMLRILDGFYHTCGHRETRGATTAAVEIGGEQMFPTSRAASEEPMFHVLHYFINAEREGRSIPNAQTVAEGIFIDVFSNKRTIERFDPDAHRTRERVESRKGYWRFCDGERRPVPLHALHPLLEYLVECKSTAIRDKASTLAEQYPGELSLALLLCRVGDMSMRALLHQELRSENSEVRRVTASHMLMVDALSSDDLQLLGYMAENDPDTNVRAILKDGLAKRRR